MVPAARGVGFAQVIGTASVVSYYCVLIALSIYYLVISCQVGSIEPEQVMTHPCSQLCPGQCAGMTCSRTMFSAWLVVWQATTPMRLLVEAT